MTGFDDEQIGARAAAGYRPGDEDDGERESDIECPCCRWRLVWTGSRLRCDNCEVYWTDRADVGRTVAALNLYPDYQEH